MRTLLRRAILAAVPAVTLPVALLAAPGTAQASPPTTQQTLSFAKTVTFAPLVGTVVTVIYNCPTAGSGAVNMIVSLQQGPNNGSTDLGVNCYGHKVKVQVNVPIGPAIAPGSAIASGLIDGDFGTTVATATVNVKFK